MNRFRCPECGTEKRLEAKFGGEIISVYCLRHIAGVDNHVRPVYMTLAVEPVAAASTERTLVPLAA
jgi:hypothetical protein